MKKLADVDTCIRRRQVLRQMGGLGAFGLVSGLTGFSSGASAASAGSYRALVCVFLYGGNDANNMIVPTGTASYASYLAARGGEVGSPGNGLLALPSAGSAGGVLPLDGVGYGLHPSMTAVQSLWNTGNAALLFNVGNLVRPFATPAAFLGNHDASSVPVNLYSHIEQQSQMQMTSLPPGTSSGWGGRVIDGLSPSGAVVPGAVSAAGNAAWLQGARSQPIVVPQTGALSYNGFSTSPASQARLAALGTLFGAASDSVFAAAVGGMQRGALSIADALHPVLSTAAAAKFSGNFPSYTKSALSQQLTQVALLIQAATTGAITAPARQIFFVGLNGFDTHNDQLNRQAPLLADLSASLAGFHQSTVQIGQSDNVISFTLSDFARTLKPASGGGSDHAWGGHHLVIGGTGAVRRGTYGAFPSLQLGGASDVSQEGRWLPTTSVDQYGATLAAWLGASTPTLAAAFPNLGNFTTPKLGFLV
jgi:uncharacterized protein (DUF1501 family)